MPPSVKPGMPFNTASLPCVIERLAGARRVSQTWKSSDERLGAKGSRSGFYRGSRYDAAHEDLPHHP